jgi:hypothetical protein
MRIELFIFGSVAAVAYGVGWPPVARHLPVQVGTAFNSFHREINLIAQGDFSSLTTPAPTFKVANEKRATDNISRVPDATQVPKPDDRDDGSFVPKAAPADAAAVIVPSRQTAPAAKPSETR